MKINTIVVFPIVGSSTGRSVDPGTTSDAVCAPRTQATKAFAPFVGISNSRRGLTCGSMEFMHVQPSSKVLDALSATQHKQH
jgi:hypothetical protein